MPLPPTLQRRLARVLFGHRAQAAWRAVLALLLMTVCGLAFDPAPKIPSAGQLDKWQHLAAFAALSFAAHWALAGDNRSARTWQSLARLALAMLAFGVFIELVQALIPARTASLADALADALGIALGLGLATTLARAAGPATA